MEDFEIFGSRFINLQNILHLQRLRVSLCKSAADRLLGSRVRIPLRAWMLDCFVCCVGNGLCDEQITRSEKSYCVRVCVCVCELCVRARA